MGNDLLIATLAMPSNRKPDWDAAKNKVAHLPPERMEAILVQMYGDVPAECLTEEGILDDGEVRLDVAACEAEIIGLIDEVAQACSSEHRHLYSSEYVVPGWRVWITGGDSWGDSPSDEWDLFVAFIEAHELADAAGFATIFAPPPRRVVA